MPIKYPKVILKLSGEIFKGKYELGIDYDITAYIAEEIKKSLEVGGKIGVVIGGGNFIRGEKVDIKGKNRVNADRIGMISTILNALALSSMLNELGIPNQILSATRVENIAEPYSVEKAEELLEKGKVVLLTGGTGNPFFSTDTAAVLRAAELNADAVLKATKVDGIYDKDPKKFPQAKKYETLKASEALEKQLKVMDLTAFSLAMESQIKIIVFNLLEPDNIKKVILGEKVGTLVEP